MPLQTGYSMVRRVIHLRAYSTDLHRQMYFASSAPRCLASASIYRGLPECLGDWAAQWYATPSLKKPRITDLIMLS